MIIQNFDFDVRAGAEPIYRGDTYFGFFRHAALANQVGIRDASPYRPGPDEAARARRFAYPRRVALPRRSLADDRLGRGVRRRWRAASAWVRRGFADGRSEGVVFQGAFLSGSGRAPGRWGWNRCCNCLKSWPPSAGGASAGSVFDSLGLGDRHRWATAARSSPATARMVTQAVVTAVDDRRQRLRADGFLERRRPRDLPDERLHARAGRGRSMKYSQGLHRGDRLRAAAGGGDLDRAGGAAGGVLRGAADPRGAARGADGDRRAAVVGRGLSGLGGGGSRGAARAGGRRRCGPKTSTS